MWPIFKKMRKNIKIGNWSVFFFPWDVLSLGTFCPLGHFVSWDVLSLGTFCPWDILSLGRFVLGTLCLRTFCLGTFCPLGRFVCAPTYVLAKLGLRQFFNTPRQATVYQGFFVMLNLNTKSIPRQNEVSPQLFSGFVTGDHCLALNQRQIVAKVVACAQFGLCTL